MDNPYSSPVAAPHDAVAGRPVPESPGTVARRTFLAWERLRIVYIVVLAATTLLLGALEPEVPLTSFRFWLFVVQGAAVANVCFFAGPFVEGYVAWLGFRTMWLRTVLFISGTLFSCALVLLAIGFEFLSEM